MEQSPPLVFKAQILFTLRNFYNAVFLYYGHNLDAVINALVFISNLTKEVRQKSP